MVELAFFSVLILTMLRFTGILVSFDFLLRKEEVLQKKFYLFIIGWSCWIVGSFLSLVSLTEEDYIFKIQIEILQDLSILLGALYLILAVISYFKLVKRNMVIIGTLIIAIFPVLIFYLFDYDLAKVAVIIVYIGLFLFLFSNAWLERKKIRLHIRDSVKWFYLTILVCFFYAIFLILMAINGKTTDLSLMEDPFLITLNSLLGLAITLLILVLTIHLEYSLSNIQKFKMKDNYSHELGNILQMILNSAEFNESTHTKGDQSINELIIEKCKSAGFLITEIRDL